MNYFKNPYYSCDNSDFVSVKNLEPSPERMRRIKVNNKFVITLLSKLYQCKSREEFMNTYIYKKFLTKILAGELPYADNVTGFNSKKLGEKLKCLVLAYCDKSRPENVQKIKESFFMNEIMFPLFLGEFTSNDAEDKWTLYKNIGTDPALKEKTPLTAAIDCYVDDAKSPVGLNFSELFDAIVVESNGNFEISTEVDDLKMQEDMVLAMKEYISVLKSNEKFKQNFNNPNVIEAEFEEE